MISDDKKIKIDQALMSDNINLRILHLNKVINLLVNHKCHIYAQKIQIILKHCI